MQIPTSDVIVEDHLGEGAFGLVFKGIISAPLRNPKLSAKLRQTIGLPVAIKLLKGKRTSINHRALRVHSLCRDARRCPLLFQYS